MITGSPVNCVEDLSSQAFRTAAADNARGGYCAKGVANILRDAGLGYTRGNAHTWDETLPENGWQKLEGITPENAPPGAVLVYDRDVNYSNKSGGHKYGHVEIVAVDNNGNRQYVSDKARDNWGGSVPGNFIGVYVNPKLHQPLDNNSHSTMLASNSTNSQTFDVATATPLIFTENERQRRNLNDIILHNTLQTENIESPTQDFNDTANASPFVMLAMIFKALFNIDMDLSPATNVSTNPQSTANVDNTTTLQDDNVTNTLIVQSM